MKRREMLVLSIAAAATGMTAPAQAQHMGGSDGTPAQFIPKKAPDPRAFENDIEKYANCPYCGMSRRQFHHSRMLVHYSDDIADGVCSLHCAAISLSLNVDRAPKAIWVGDNADSAAVKPLVDVDKATFLVGSSISGVMTHRSKVAYGNASAAKTSQAANGGELMDFDRALLAAYTDMSRDVTQIRKMRGERNKPGMGQKH